MQETGGPQAFCTHSVGTGDGISTSCRASTHTRARGTVCTDIFMSSTASLTSHPRYGEGVHMEINYAWPGHFSQVQNGQGIVHRNGPSVGVWGDMASPHLCPSTRACLSTARIFQASSQASSTGTTSSQASSDGEEAPPFFLTTANATIMGDASGKAFGQVRGGPRTTCHCRGAVPT